MCNLWISDKASNMGTGDAPRSLREREESRTSLSISATENQQGMWLERELAKAREDH